MSTNRTTEPKASHWRRWFSRPQQTPEVQTSSLPVPPASRSYTPRHADRDMVMSVPVSQRPELVRKARENRLKGVCSEIGFSTDSLPKVPSMRAYPTSQTSIHATRSEPTSQASSTFDMRHSARESASSSASMGSASSSRISHSYLTASSCTSASLRSSPQKEECWRGLDLSTASRRTNSVSDLNLKKVQSTTKDGASADSGDQHDPRESQTASSSVQGLSRDSAGTSYSAVSSDKLHGNSAPPTPRKYFSHNSTGRWHGAKGKQPAWSQGDIRHSAQTQHKVSPQPLRLSTDLENFRREEQTAQGDSCLKTSSRNDSYAASGASESISYKSSKGSSVASTAATEHSEAHEEPPKDCDEDRQQSYS